MKTHLSICSYIKKLEGYFYLIVTNKLYKFLNEFLLRDRSISLKETEPTPESGCSPVWFCSRCPTCLSLQHSMTGSRSIYLLSAHSVRAVNVLVGMLKVNFSWGSER